MINMYGINLKKDAERRKSLLNQLNGKESLVKFNLIEAIDGKTDPEVQQILKQDKGRIYKKAGFMMNEGEVACLLSHKKALKSFLETNEPYGIIVEDDIKFEMSFWEALPVLKKEFLAGRIDFFNFITKKRRFFKLNQVRELSLIQHFSNGPSTVGYMITPNVAKVLLEFESLAPFDTLTKELIFRGYSHITTYSPLIGVVNFKSSIDEQSLQKRKALKGLKRSDVNVFLCSFNKIKRNIVFYKASFKYNIKKFGFFRTFFVFLFGKKSQH